MFVISCFMLSSEPEVSLWSRYLLNATIKDCSTLAIRMGNWRFCGLFNLTIWFSLA